MKNLETTTCKPHHPLPVKIQLRRVTQNMYSLKNPAWKSPSNRASKIQNLQPKNKSSQLTRTRRRSKKKESKKDKMDRYTRTRTHHSTWYYKPWSFYSSSQATQLLFKGISPMHSPLSQTRTKRSKNQKFCKSNKWRKPRT